MNFWAKVAMLLLFVAALKGGAQSATENQSRAQGTQERGFWVDSSTGLMWAGKDNGVNINWKNAVKYCRDLRLAGYPDWRLATLSELEGIYDEHARSSGQDGHPGTYTPSTYHVKGNLFLTGTQWSSTRRMDDRGKPSGFAWRFSFDDGKPFGGDEEWFATNKRALCVRSSAKTAVPSR
jgi:Protein of unknown function (DUF1566)